MIYNFNTLSSLDIKKVGGKAKALIEMTNAGFSVPEGIVLTVDFFSEWLDEIKNTEEWSNLLSNVSKKNCDVIIDIARKMNFTPNQRKVFEREFNSLPGNIYAVRSSSPEEDLEGSSFAGMYETYLGITVDKIEEYVATAFSSCFDFRVAKYKKENNILLDHTSIAIIIQRQINSDTSGVGFSLNPLNNSYDEVMINATYGLGEAVVSGIVVPDTYIIDSVKNEIINTELGEKETSLHLMDNGGIKKSQVIRKETQALNQEEIMMLVKLIKECESYYGKPIDTEWAFESGKLFLLQARPITTYIPLSTGLLSEKGREKYLYLDILSITQGFSEPLSVLGTDIWRGIMETSGGGLFNSSVKGTAPIVDGRQFFNIFYLYKVFGKKTGNAYIYNHGDSVKRIMETIDEEEFKIKRIPKVNKGLPLKMLKMGKNFGVPVIKTFFSSSEDTVNKYLQLYEETLLKTEDYYKIENFNEIYEHAMEDLKVLVQQAIGVIAIGGMASSKLHKLFKEYDVKEELTSLSIDLKGNPTSEMGQLMYILASSTEFIQTTSEEEFINNIKNRKYSQDFMKIYDKFLQRHGARTFKEIDIAAPRSGEDLGDLYNRLLQINVEESQIKKSAAKKEAAYHKLHQISIENKFEKKFIKQAEIFNTTFGYREYIKYATVNFVAILRKIVLEISKEFVSDGRLDSIEEIFNLTIDEITKAQKDATIDLQKLRIKNLEPYEKVKHIKYFPMMIDSRGKVYNPKLEIKDGDLIGTSVANGKKIGKAKILNSPYEKPVNPGEIIVTRSTEPSWTPIFINASGVVMEVGGPLQHGGIIAREYGIPCVSGIIGITELIKDGDLIEVDGTNGIIRILEQS